MSGVICRKCFNSTNEPRHPVCERDDCPGKETFMRFDNAVANELMDAASNDAERAIQRAEKAEHDLKCLQESTVDRKAYARLRAERDEAVGHIECLLKFYGWRSIPGRAAHVFLTKREGKSDG